MKKSISLKELRDPNAPYVKKNIKVIRITLYIGIASIIVQQMTSVALLY